MADDKKNFPIWKVLAIVLILVGISLGLSFIPKPSESSYTKFMEQGSQPMGDAIGLSKGTYLNWLSYLFGEVPNFLIGITSTYSALIVTLGIFVIVLLMFSDILVTFGTFSDKNIAWVIGTILAIIAVNFKFTMIILAFSLSLVAGLGAISVAFGIAIPFLTYGLVQFGLLKNLKHWLRDMKDAENFKKNTSAIKTGMKGMKEIGKELHSP